MKILYEFFKCEDCPYCRKGRTYGNDGRDGHTVFVCSKGAFGGYEKLGRYAYGESFESVRKGINNNCPLNDISECVKNIEKGYN